MVKKVSKQSGVNVENEVGKLIYEVKALLGWRNLNGRIRYTEGSQTQIKRVEQALKNVEAAQELKNNT